MDYTSVDPVTNFLQMIVLWLRGFIVDLWGFVSTPFEIMGEEFSLVMLITVGGTLVTLLVVAISLHLVHLVIG